MSKSQFTSNATTTQSTFSILGKNYQNLPSHWNPKLGIINHYLSLNLIQFMTKISLILSTGDSNVQPLSRIIEPKQIFPIPDLQSETENATTHFSMLHELFPWKDTNNSLDPSNMAQITKQSRISPSPTWETNELTCWISKHRWGVV